MGDDPMTDPSSNPTWDEQLLRTLQALGDDRRDEGRTLLRALTRQAPEHAFDAHLVHALERLSEGAVDPYVNDAGFRAFIRGGGNVPIYQQLSARLGERLGAMAPVEMLDIGCGDGLVYEPLPASLFTSVDLVEPSAMLANAERLLHGKQISTRGHPMTIEAFLAKEPGRSWNVALASFSLQHLPPAQRAGVLAELRRCGTRLFIAEFDVPAAARGDARARFDYMIERYRRGLDEYPDNGTVVAEGFLVPIFLSAFWQKHVSYEQSLEDWKREMSGAGFGEVRVLPLHRYWWADAFLLEAAP